MDRYPDRKGRTAVAVRKGIPHNHVELLPLVSVEATGVCIPVGNNIVLLAAVYKSPGPPWDSMDIFKLLGLKRKTLCSSDLNAKHPFWNSSVSNPSGVELLELFLTKAKPDTKNIRGLNLVAVKLTTVQVSRLLL
jgi:hypothetical protein